MGFSAVYLTCVCGRAGVWLNVAWWWRCVLVLGLDDVIGNFEVGKEFDALLMEPGVTRSKFVVVTNFDTVQVTAISRVVLVTILATAEFL